MPTAKKPSPEEVGADEFLAQLPQTHIGIFNVASGPLG